MNLAPETSTVKRSLSAHAAIGLLAGALLYIVCLSGSLLVFYEEWQRLETPAAPRMTAIDPDAVQRGMEAVLAREVDQLALWSTFRRQDAHLFGAGAGLGQPFGDAFHSLRLDGNQDFVWSDGVCLTGVLFAQERGH